MGEGRQGSNSVGGVDERVTISEAATLLGVHPNTVRNRVKDGTYKAEKFITKSGPTWMIERNSLLTNTPPSTSQQAPSQRETQIEAQVTQLVQDLLRPFVEDLGRVREELGAERVRREQAEQERDRLAAELEELREAREPPVPPSEEPASTHTPPTPEHPVERPSWWRRFFGFE